ncbi:MAG: SHOCT domain-containing protein [Actinomycetota bacterium]|nr:SHOCT domain-containing protein [Actinomycetota bacterium]
MGGAMVLFAAVLVGVGMHHMIMTGSCSSTGYSSVGPVPHCPKGFGWWIGFLVGGIFLVMIGGALSGAPVLIVPAIFSAIGAGAITVNLDSGVHSDLKTFGLLFGGGFLVFGVIPGVLILLSALRSSGGPPPAPVMAPIYAFSSAASPPGAILGATAGSTGAQVLGGTSPSVLGGTSPSVLGGPSPSAQPVASSAGTPSTGQALDEIGKLAELRDKGVLTDEEFAREKSKLLGQL